MSGHGHGLYRVTGKRAYRGHEHGTVFEALLDPAAERRAIVRGDIVLLERIIPDLEPGSFMFPDGWLPPPDEVVPVVNRGAERRLTHRRAGR